MGRVELTSLLQSLPVQHIQASAGRRNEPVSSELPHGAVDMDDGESGCIAELLLGRNVVDRLLGPGQRLELGLSVRTTDGQGGNRTICDKVVAGTRPAEIERPDDDATQDGGLATT
jgi:hypothetical protein